MWVRLVKSITDFGEMLWPIIMAICMNGAELINEI